MKKKAPIQYPSLWDDLPAFEKADWLGKAAAEPQIEDDLQPNQKSWEKAILLFHTDVKTAYSENAVFAISSLGMTSHKENYDFDADKVLQKINALDKSMQAEKQKNRAQALLIEVEAIEKNTFEPKREKLRPICVRPFVQKFTYYDDLPYLQLYHNRRFFPLDSEVENSLIVFSNGNKNTAFYNFASNTLVASESGEKRYCMALYSYDNEGNKEVNISDEALAVFRKNYHNLRPKLEKKDIFNYVFGVLNSLHYQQKYAAFLQNESPRIPFYADFWKWAGWGRRLMTLQLNIDKIDAFHLEREDKTMPEIVKDLSELTGLPEEFDLPLPKNRLRFHKDKGMIEIDTQTTLFNIPEQAQQFVLGSKTAIEWVLEGYKENKNNENGLFANIAPYRLADYKEKLVAKIEKIVATSIEMAEILA